MDKDSKKGGKSSLFDKFLKSVNLKKDPKREEQDFEGDEQEGDVQGYYSENGFEDLGELGYLEDGNIIESSNAKSKDSSIASKSPRASDSQANKSLNLVSPKVPKEVLLRRTSSSNSPEEKTFKSENHPSTQFIKKIKNGYYLNEEGNQELFVYCNFAQELPEHDFENGNGQNLRKPDSAKFKGIMEALAKNTSIKTFELGLEKGDSVLPPILKTLETNQVTTLIIKDYLPSKPKCVQDILSHPLSRKIATLNVMGTGIEFEKLKQILQINPSITQLNYDLPVGQNESVIEDLLKINCAKEFLSKLNAKSLEFLSDQRLDTKLVEQLKLGNFNNHTFTDEIRTTIQNDDNLSKGAKDFFAANNATDIIKCLNDAKELMKSAPASAKTKKGEKSPKSRNLSETKESSSPTSRGSELFPSSPSTSPLMSGKNPLLIGISTKQKHMPAITLTTPIGSDLSRT